MKYIFLLFLTTALFSSCNKKDDLAPFYFRNGNADLWVDIDGNVSSNVFVIYLHGGPGQGSNVYNQGLYAQEMEKDYAMVYVDQRGNGASQGSYSKDELSVSNIANDIYQLTLFLKAKYGSNISVFLSGHSWGGLTSANALITTDIQNEIKGWIEIDGVNDLNQNEIEVVKMLKSFANQEIANGNNTDFWQPVLERVNTIDTLNVTLDDGSYLNSTGFDAQKKFSLASTDVVDIYFPFNPNNSSFGLGIKMANTVAQIRLNQDSDNYALTNQLHKIQVPSLFLWGKYDFVVPPSMGQMAYDLVSSTDKEIVIFDNSGHSPMQNEGELMTQKVKEFIELHK